MLGPENYVLRRKGREDLDMGQVLYGENEPVEMQLENLWEVVDCRTGERLEEPQPDFSQFSDSDRMYPSMMRPEVRAAWDQKKRDWEWEMKKYARIKRMAHAAFMLGNPDHRLSQEMAETDYGRELAAEFGRGCDLGSCCSGSAPQMPEYGGLQTGFAHRQPQAERHGAQGTGHMHRQPQAGTGSDLWDEFGRDDVEYAGGDTVRKRAFRVPGGGEPYSSIITERDGNGRVIKKNIALEPKDHQLQYEYDRAGRLCRVYKDGRAIEQYQYGIHGERLTAETYDSSIRRFEYGGGLKLLRAGEVRYSYDPEGRMVMKEDRGQVTRYEYQDDGKLWQVHLPDGRRIEYLIDPQGARVAKSIDGRVVEKYLWSDLTTLAKMTDGQNENVREFAYDEDGDPLAMSWNGRVYHFAADQVGTIYMVANRQGDELKRIIYDSFGNLMVDSDERLYIPLGFAAGLHDPDTGLIHFGHREYDPAIGRFTTPDPLGEAGGDVDLYGYCHDDPVNFVDRMGLRAESKGAGDEEKDGEESTPGFAGRVGRAFSKSVKGAGHALYDIGELGIRAGVELTGEAADGAHKAFSPLTHPETKNEASEFIKRKINGDEPSHKVITDAAKEGWENMVEKERNRLEGMKSSARALRSSKVIDAYGRNATKRKNRAETIKTAVSSKLKNMAEVYLTTPDHKMTPISITVQEMREIQRNKR